LYEALGLPFGADERQIKDAYRSLARRFHPDVNGGDSAGAERLAEINRAYATLGNPQSRAAYDRDLAQRRTEIHRRLIAFAASGVLSFVVTAVVATAIIRRDVQPPPAAEAPPPRTNVALPAAAQSPADPRDHVRAAVWETYRDARFDFALRYPAGIFAFEPTRSDAHVNTFVSPDGQAVLRIVAAKNTSRMTLGSYRSMLMKDRYAGAAFKPAARREQWFVLSGTLGDQVFLERVTFSCDSSSMHGWQIRYPSSQRATYDDLAKLILRNHPHGNGPGCGEAEPKRKRQAGRPRD
jgi:hypothetical protein